MPELPAALTYGYVVGRYLLAIGDTTRDDDRLPDPIAASGTVRFRPTVAAIRSAGGLSPVVVPQLVTATLDDEGWLTDTAGSRGVWLVAGSYDVSFQFGAVALAPFRIFVTPDHTERAPLDLGAETPFVPAPGEVFVVNEAVRAETLAARDETLEILESIRDAGGITGAELERSVTDLVNELTADLYPDAGYDVVVILGQSNAQGAAVDFTRALEPDVDPRRVYQYGATAKDNPRPGAGQIMPASDPLIHRWTQTNTDGSAKLTKGPGLPFARKYAPTLDRGRRLLLVPAAYSGTGFNKTNHGSEMSTHWRPNDLTGVNLYESAIAQTKAALLAAGPGARLVAAIWVQGETDEVTAPAAYRDYLLALIDGLRTRLSAPQLPFLIGGMVPEGVAAVPGRALIDGVHREIPSLRPYTSFSAGPSGKFIDSGLHYSAAGQEDLGAALFAGLSAARANVPNPPAQVTTLTAGAPGSAAVPLSWSAAARATSYFVERKATSASTWMPVAETTSTSITVVGLTPQTAYDFRVKSSNTGGTAAPSSTVSATTLASGFVLSDLATPATRAYGTRRMHAAYSGPALRVVRLSDSTRMDVPFDERGDLDTATMLAWAGSATVSVETFYDLTGNGLHLTQSTPTNMARLALNGTLDTIGGKPAPVGNANTFYSGTFTGPSLYARGSSTVCAVSYGAATANGRLVSETSSSAVAQQYVPIMANATNSALVSQRITDDTAASVAPDTATAAAFATSTLVQITSTDTGSAFVKRVNGADAGTVTYTRSGALTLNTFTWGGLFRNGTFGAPIATRPIELVAFPSALSSADRAVVEASQKAYFGTP
ncbi:hypothetical protein DZF92_04585 [Clavibacter michiganensis subsp. insidiosus]|uniref:Fibronectin type-III domain-containing protein n=1 Tax=Clavibacter michiganensis subsp. insidiosus TaxID=33014 RepID=A0A399SK87_9MICO|nr:sialate O-acetylesterase [Clavibacter michiganensis]AWG01182.1 hypothetical protein BEH62_06180 [Clavibacter michiganensis subsp. insidiosus]OQJ60258.1 hypothetical protein B5P21_10305 [Clavibacter michiganensis subsp. insidiosus]RII88045.1 hypothetical protein DZF92_04585 [Clavibacter michiganensis subsp. insidiosus]RIJ43638.1 hypothetical protein DZF93_05820 [Clavibacter michiganensis subsp. insidiosus]RMC85596.1 hypothetical protein CmiCFBP2404_07240 [Clavibacter michiganensis subsp. ins